MDVENPLADCRHETVKRFVFGEVDEWRCAVCGQLFEGGYNAKDAAPALLASLRECVLAYDFAARGHHGIAERARAAIAKAEGSAPGFSAESSGDY